MYAHFNLDYFISFNFFAYWNFADWNEKKLIAEYKKILKSTRR